MPQLKTPGPKPRKAAQDGLFGHRISKNIFVRSRINAKVLLTFSVRGGITVATQTFQTQEQMSGAAAAAGSGIIPSLGAVAGSVGSLAGAFAAYNVRRTLVLR